MKKQNGFTLVELVIVIAVLGILAGLAIPYFMEAREEAAQKECLANRTQILRMFHAQQAQGYSGDLTAFLAEVTKEENNENKYFTFIPKCADNGTYSVAGDIVVCSIKEHNEDDIIFSGSMGKDFYDKVIDALKGLDLKSNDAVRKWWQDQGNDWDKLQGTVGNDGKDLYLMFHTGTNPANKDPLIYANPNATGQNWKAKYIYDNRTDTWYRYKDSAAGGSNSGIDVGSAMNESGATGSGYIDKNVIGNDKWEEVTLNGNTFSK